MRVQRRFVVGTKTRTALRSLRSPGHTVSRTNSGHWWVRCFLTCRCRTETSVKLWGRDALPMRPYSSSEPAWATPGCRSRRWAIRPYWPSWLSASSIPAAWSRWLKFWVRANRTGWKAWMCRASVAGVRNSGKSGPGPYFDPNNRPLRTRRTAGSMHRRAMACCQTLGRSVDIAGEGETCGTSLRRPQAARRDHPEAPYALRIRQDATRVGRSLRPVRSNDGAGKDGSMDEHPERLGPAFPGPHRRTAGANYRCDGTTIPAGRRRRRFGEERQNLPQSRKVDRPDQSARRKRNLPDRRAGASSRTSSTEARPGRGTEKQSRRRRLPATYAYRSKHELADAGK